MIEFAVLGSGSSGNSAVVRYKDTNILVDAGLSARQIAVRLEEVGVDPDSLTAILLTHEHGDHVQGLDVFLRKRSIPVYGTVHTCHIVQEDKISRADISWRKFSPGNTFSIGDLEIDSFNVPHDAIDPVGFVFRAKEGSLGILSDVGHVTRLIVENLKGVDSLFVESNYDNKMLQDDEKRPWSLKQRISNRHGHLSNEQTADLLREVAHSGMNHVVLGHLSSDCNTPECAKSFISGALDEMGLSEVAVTCAERKSPTPMFSAVKGHQPSLEEDISTAVAAIEENLKETASKSAPVLVDAKATASQVGSSIIGSGESFKLPTESPAPKKVSVKKHAPADESAVQLELSF